MGDCTGWYGWRNCLASLHSMNITDRILSTLSILCLMWTFKRIMVALMTLFSLVLSGLECLSVRQQVSPEHFNLLFMTGLLSEGHMSRETPSSFFGTDKKSEKTSWKNDPGREWEHKRKMQWQLKRKGSQRESDSWRSQGLPECETDSHLKQGWRSPSHREKKRTIQGRWGTQLGVHSGVLGWTFIVSTSHNLFPPSWLVLRRVPPPWIDFFFDPSTTEASWTIFPIFY